MIAATTRPTPTGSATLAGTPSVQQPLPKPQPERGAGERAGQDTDERDADLDGRQELARVIGQRQRAARADDVAVDHGLKAGPAGRDDGQFRHRQEAVDQNENEDDGQFKEKHVATYRHRSAAVRSGKWPGSSAAAKNYLLKSD